MVTTTDKKIEKLADILAEEIAERKVAIHTISIKQEEQKNYVVSLIPQLKTNHALIKEQVDRLQKIKQEILGYAFQSVTIIIGLLAIIFSIVFFVLNPEVFNEFIWLYISILMIFIVLFIMWFILWVIRR